VGGGSLVEATGKWQRYHWISTGNHAATVTSFADIKSLQSLLSTIVLSCRRNQYHSRSRGLGCPATAKLIMAKADPSVLCLAAVVLVVLSCISSEVSPRQHHLNDRSLKHVSRVRSFECREPQKRLVPLKDLGVNVSPEISYYPPATVLRRCDCATGYCPDPEHVCRPKDTAVVELVFRISNQVERGQKYMTVNATEHVTCLCQPITSQIK
jgi:hypothetical protein